MSVSLDANVEAQLDSGRYVLFHLVKFDIPGKPTGYWRGPRNLVWNGFTYRPSRYLDDSGLSETLGLDIAERSLTFSNVPSTDADDVIAQVESYNYLNAPVTVTKLLGDVETDEILGIVASSVYEINSLNYQQPAVDGNGETAVTVQISLEIPGRIVRDKTGGKYSSSEQKAHNNPTDTFFEYGAASASWPELWGRVSG